MLGSVNLAGHAVGIVINLPREVRPANPEYISGAAELAKTPVFMRKKTLMTSLSEVACIVYRPIPS